MKQTNNNKSDYFDKERYKVLYERRKKGIKDKTMTLVFTKGNLLVYYSG